MTNHSKTPPDYKPPTSAEELLKRYAKGERETSPCANPSRLGVMGRVLTRCRALGLTRNVNTLLNGGSGAGESAARRGYEEAK